MCGVWDPSKDAYKCSIPCSEPNDIPNDGKIRPGVETTTTTTIEGEGKEDVPLCLPCDSGTEIVVQVTKPPKVVMCKSCGGRDHSRRSSKLCKFFKGKKSGSTHNSILVSTASVSNDPIKSEVKKVLDGLIDRISSNNSSNQEVVAINSSCVVEDSISSPSFIYVGKDESEKEAKKRYTPVVDVESDDFHPIGTVFKIFEKNHHNRKVEVVPTPDVLVRKYWSYSIVSQLVVSSNKYIEDRKKVSPHLDCCKRKKDSRPITVGCMYHFLAMIYYMGIVRLPDTKEDYWSTEKWMPEHPICIENGMTRNRFRFIWRHFHVSHQSETGGREVQDNQDGETMAGEVHQRVNRVEREQDNDLDSESDSDSEDGTTVDNNDDSKKVWFDKLSPLIEHFRNVSEEIIFVLGSNMSLDEMIIRFAGRSNETHRIKNKPIGEGYKFFVLSTFNGFVVNFTPDGRTAARKDEQEYNSKSRGMGKTEAMILHLLEIIDKFKNKQEKRNKKRYNSQKKATRTGVRSGSTELFAQESIQHVYIVAMDNYFTLPKVISKLCELGIGIVGTSRFKQNWPPTELKNINDDNAQFNDFYWMIHENETLIARWKDNGMVFCVSTVHSVGNKVKRNRKRPRITNKNRNHVGDVWGDNGCVEVFIPTLIDNYNHWMGGVDLSDQRIAYYHPDMRCYRNWIPMFIQILSMVRNNSYLVYCDHYKSKAMSHKSFTLKMIDELMSESSFYYQNEQLNNPSQQIAVDKVPPNTPPQASSIRPILQSPSSSISSLSTFQSPSSITSSRNNLRKNTTSSMTSANFAPGNHSLPSSTSKQATTTKLPPPKRRKTTKAQTLDDYPARLKGLKKDHIRVKSNVRDRNGKLKRQAKACAYCSLLLQKNRKTTISRHRETRLAQHSTEETWDKQVKRTEFFCSHCKVYLCSDHFDPFHEDQV